MLIVRSLLGFVVECLLRFVFFIRAGDFHRLGTLRQVEAGGIYADRGDDAAWGNETDILGDFDRMARSGSISSIFSCKKVNKGSGIILP